MVVLVLKRVWGISLVCQFHVSDMGAGFGRQFLPAELRSTITLLVPIRGMVQSYR